MKTKKRISKDEGINQVLNLLKDGLASEEIVSDMCSEFQISDRTVYSYLKIARKTYDKERERAQKEIERVRVEQAAKAAENGLKSKYERDIEIQNEIEHYQAILKGEKKVPFILGQKVSQTESLPIQLVVLVQNTINDLRKELAKRLGEYAADKHEHEVEIKLPPYFK